MSISQLPADLRKLAKPVMTDKDWARLGAAWEANKRNKRKDALSPEQLSEINFLLKKGTSVRETANIVKVNRGRVWYIYKNMVDEKTIPPAVNKKGRKKKVKAENFI